VFTSGCVLFIISSYLYLILTRAKFFYESVKGDFMNFKDLASNLGLDEEEFIELVELFVSTSLGDIARIRKAVRDNNAADAASASHSIKGAAGNMGFDDIFTRARDMEMQAKQGSLDGFDELLSGLESMVKALDSSSES
jgi:HPt (histidine-containing phosphotransfer) domain-containing protein